jgi:hypothetical protein
MKFIDYNFIKAAKIIFLFFVFFKTSSGYSQVSGCRDPSASNYNPSATVNDGSCLYNDTYYTPPVLVDPISDTLKESSGLQWANNSLWSFNDRGGKPDLYRIDTVTGTILQTVRLGGATNVDWEETAFDGTYFYVGDFGNNLDGARTDLKIYKFPFSAIPDYITNPDATIDSAKIEIINFTYSDNQLPDSVALNSTKFDCEAMIIDEGKIHLFTKNWVDLTSTHYVINNTLAGTYIAARSETLNTGYLVTAATKAPGKKIAELLGYDNSLFKNHYLHILSDYSGGKYFNGNKRKINLPSATYMGQAEGITFRNDSSGYISNERISGIVDQRLFSFNTASFIPSNVLAEELNKFSVSRINGTNKIEWNFSLNVYGLEVQQSADGLHFTVIKTYNNSVAGSLYNKPATELVYYRLGWKLNSGDYHYSKIIRLKNEENTFINNLVLRASGELSFILNGNQSEEITFKLVGTDGKMLSQSAAHSYMPGFNKINLLHSAVSSNVVVIVVNTNKQKVTEVLHVLK